MRLNAPVLPDILASKFRNVLGFSEKATPGDAGLYRNDLLRTRLLHARSHVPFLYRAVKTHPGW